MRAAEALVSLESAERQRSLGELAGTISTMLKNGDENSVRQAVLRPSSSQAARALYYALDAALAPPAALANVNLHVFAIPVLFVVGAPMDFRLPGIVPDTEAIRLLFEKSGALGHCRNFGLSNALAALESVEAIPWVTLHMIANASTWSGFDKFDLPPADIQMTANCERVHLRFLSGAALLPSEAPAFVESAGNISGWGMPLTGELGRQFAMPDVSVLAIPRTPRSIVRAILDGWFAIRDLGFQLFLSNALRRARMCVGEPEVTISAGSDQTIRIRLTSSFDELFDETYGWPLAASDDLDEIVKSMTTLMREMRLERMRVMTSVEHVITAAH